MINQPGSFVPHPQMSADGTQWIQIGPHHQGGGGQRLQHPGAPPPPMAMMGSGMVGMTFVPAQSMQPIGMVAPMQQYTMVDGRGLPMDASGMGLLQPMGTFAPMGSNAQPQVQQYVYQGVAGQQVLDPSQGGGGATGGGWGGGEGAGAAGFTTLAEQQPLGVAEYGQAGQRHDPSNLGAFGAMPMPSHLACAGGGGSFTMGGGGLGLLERQMSSTTLSSDDSPTGSAWDRLCARPAPPPPALVHFPAPNVSPDAARAP